MIFFEHTKDGLNRALLCVEKLPDDKFTDILSDPERVEAVKAVFEKKKSNRKIGKTEKASLSFWSYQNDRDLLNRAIVYIKSRLDWADSQQAGLLKRDDIPCFGKPDGVKWLDSVCAEAGFSFVKSAQEIKTEQEKDAEQQAGRDAVAEHLSKKRKPVKETQTVIPTPETISATNKPETTDLEPEIGTAFLASGINFVLFRPSEAHQMPARSAIVDKYFYADTISLLYGQAGSYKTMFALWEGVSFVIGKELCGMPINEPKHRVLYVSLEMTVKDIADRLSGMTKDLTDAERSKVDDNFLIVSAENTQGMKATDDFLSALSQLCADQGFDIVYIDSFADYIAGHDIRSENEMTAIIDKLRSFVLNHHVSFRIIHHGTKPTQDTNGSMAGIHTIRDLVDNVYLIKANDTKEITVSSDMQQDKSAKSRFSEPVTLKLKFIADSGSLSFKRIQDTETKSYLEKVSELKTIIEENQGISAGELRTMLHNPKDLTKIIDGEIQAGSIICDPEKAGNGTPKKRYYTAEYYKVLKGS